VESASDKFKNRQSEDPNREHNQYDAEQIDCYIDTVNRNFDSVGIGREVEADEVVDRRDEQDQQCNANTA